MAPKGQARIWREVPDILPHYSRLATTVDEGVMKGESLDVLVARPIVQKNHVYYTVSVK